jgi:hypothetical protein
MTVTLDLPQEFIDLCKRHDVTPEEVIKGFVADVSGIINWGHPDPSQGRFPRPNDGYQSNGSDERRLALEYFERVGYPYRKTMDK